MSNRVKEKKQNYTKNDGLQIAWQSSKRSKSTMSVRVQKTPVCQPAVMSRSKRSSISRSISKQKNNDSVQKSKGRCLPLVWRGRRNLSLSPQGMGGGWRMIETVSHLYHNFGRCIYHYIAEKMMMINYNCSSPNNEIST